MLDLVSGLPVSCGGVSIIVASCRGHSWQMLEATGNWGLEFGPEISLSQAGHIAKSLPHILPS